MQLNHWIIVVAAWCGSVRAQGWCRVKHTKLSSKHEKNKNIFYLGVDKPNTDGASFKMVGFSKYSDCT